MPNSKINELARRLEKMKNPAEIGISIGEVIKKDPLTISIAGGLVKLVEGEELEVCENLKERVFENVRWEWEEDGETKTREGTITIDPDIKKGDLIVVLPEHGEQSWIAAGRIAGGE